MGKKKLYREPWRMSGENCLKYLFFGSFFLGVLLANLSGNQKLMEYGIFNTYFLKQFEYSNISFTDLFLYIFETRVPVILFLLFFGVTEFWYLIHGLFVLWNGGALGFLFVAGISNLGIKGILLVLFSLVPQYLFYIVMYVIIFLAQEKLHKNVGESFSGGKYGRWAMYFVACGLAMLVLFLGMLSETYLNPIIMKKILKIY